MILEKSRISADNFTLHLFLKKQKLKDDSYLFEAITETLQLRNQDPRLRGVNQQHDDENLRESLTTVNKANQIDIFLQKYSVTNKILKHFSLTVFVQY